MGKFLGQLLPAHFGSVEQEWRAATQSCAVLDASFRRLVAVTGGDRVAFLHGMLTNDIKALGPGRGVRAAQLDQSGKIVSDLRVYAEPARLLLDVLTQREAAMTENLERYLIADDVVISPLLGEEVPLLALEGPCAAEVTTRMLRESVPDTSPLDHWQGECAGVSVRVVAASEVGARGYLLCGPGDAAGALFAAACAAGAQPMGMEALEVLRVEAGVPRYGQDMDETCLIMEVGLSEAISFRKGCYLGQEVVERIAARGHVNRRLVGLTVEGTAVPAAGSPVMLRDRQVGHITSAVWSLALRGVAALGYVHRSCCESGVRLGVASDGGPLHAVVAQLPFERVGNAP